jgi:hypothetical protein
MRGEKEDRINHLPAWDLRWRSASPGRIEQVRSEAPLLVAELDDAATAGACQPARVRLYGTDGPT